MNKQIVSPELIFTNAAIYTAGASAGWANAIAVRDGIITAVGEADQVAELSGPDTTTIDLGGKMMMPGIIDVHTHLMLGGQSAAWELAIEPTASIDEVIEIIAREATSSVAGAWIIGGLVGSLAMNEITNASFLARLDAASAGHPVLLRDDTQHNRWVNSVTLGLMGVDDDTPDLPGGVYVRDSDGNLTGVMWELASRHAEEVAISATPNQDARNAVSARRAIEVLNSFGITGTQEAATFESALRAFRDLDQAAQLNAWVVSSLPARDFVIGVGDVGERLFDKAEQYRTEHVRPDFVKAVVDGIPMSYTAAFLEPYAGSHDHGHAYRGETYFTLPDLVRLLDTCHSRGLGCKLHATGDGAVRQILDAVEIIRSLRGPGPTFQIAHVEFVSPDDLPRFAELGVVADMSPAMWFPSPMSLAIDAVLPPDVMKRMWPLRELVDSTATVAAGSDWPCAMPVPDPWIGIETMVTRTNPDGAYPGVLNADQALTLAEVIQTYTINPAKAIGLGSVTGSLEVGKSADLIVLNQNIFDIDPACIHDTKVEQTYFAGRLVYEGSQ
ncbi:amidohydrolase [Subtercola sp. YIM 133946]|uniref:amidohydrolase n=1 Tax=Subtercola sp. YIM 133946 TaxID=3118909 RepID=UPI002F93458F